jgi:N-hydroxyarylamine O-acetyltransferase
VSDLSAENVDRYLRRLGLQRDDVSLDLDGLRRLQWTHLTSIPFTNLDVHDGLPVTTSLDWSIPAVVEGRGGWCFVLNGAFGALLSSLGFEVTSMGALVTMGGAVSPMDDHLCLKVSLDEDWLVDVGFGDAMTRPMLLDSDDILDDVAAGRRFRLSTGDDGLRQLESELLGPDADSFWRLDYRFALDDRDLEYFSPANDYLIVTPGLTWTRKRFSTRLTDTGRVTLLEDRIKHTMLHGEDLEVELGDQHAWEAARRRHLPTPR